MKTDQDNLDIIDLGAASVVTQGNGLISPEPVGRQPAMGISDAD